MTNSTKSSMDNPQMSNAKHSNTALSALSTTQKVALSLKKRHQKERRFRKLGIFDVLFGFILVVILFSDITSKELPFSYTH